MALCGYGVLDKYALSRERQATAHPTLRWLAVASFCAGPLYMFIVLLPTSVHSAREAADGAARKQAEGSQTESPDTGNKAEDAFHKGEIAYQKQDYDVAIGCFTEAIRLKPDYAPGYCNRANAYWCKGNVERSIADFTEAVRLKPDYTEAYYCRGYAYAKTAAPGKAIADFTEAIRLTPDSPNLYCYRGTAYLDNDEPEKAIADFTEAVRLNPVDAVAHFSRGNAYYRSGEHDNAVADYSEAIRLNPNCTDAFYYRGAIYCAEGEYAKAIADCNQTLTLDPNSAITYNQLAWLQATCPDEKYRDGRKAVENASKANQLTQGTNCSCIDTLAAAYAEEGDFGKAKEWAAKAIELAPSDITLTEEQKAGVRARLELYERGKPYHDKTKPPKAVLRITPERAEAAKASFDRGEAYWNNGKSTSAVAAYTKAIELDPQCVDAYCGRGRVYETSKNYDLAIADYTEAIRIDPKYTAAYRFRGRAYVMRGDESKATVDFAEAKRLESAGQ